MPKALLLWLSKTAGEKKRRCSSARQQIVHRRMPQEYLCASGPFMYLCHSCEEGAEGQTESALPVEAEDCTDTGSILGLKCQNDSVALHLKDADAGR